MSESDVELGFLEDCESWQVESRFFPSKVGGKPAWLNLDKLPSPEQLSCRKCSNPMLFLCQLYAPYEEDIQDSPNSYVNNFHRTIFVFICMNDYCCTRNDTGNLKVFRSSLQRTNKYYPYDPPENKPTSDFALSNWVTLCAICGCLSDKQCSKCKQTNYCSRVHQILDWKEGHKKECGSGEVICKRTATLLFPEWEIVTEPENIEEKETSVEEELEKFNKLSLEGKIGSMDKTLASDLESFASGEKDKTFSKFKQRVNHYPDQVIRYKRGGQPLWIAKGPVPAEIPDCEECKGPRHFEFQIMPQMLSYFKESELDWGVLAVYTCKNSCTLDGNYKEEFIFKQDVDLIE